MSDAPEFIPGRSPLRDLPSGAAALVEASKGLLIAGGFDALRIAKITATAGQNRAMVNYYFGSKAAMVAVVVDSLIHEALEELTVQLDGLPEGDTRIGALVDSTVDLMQTPEFLATLDVVPPALRDEDLRARLATLYTWYRDMVCTGLGPEAEGVPEGRVRLLATLFVALFDGLAIQWALDPESVDLDALTPLVKDMVVFLLGRGEATSG
jgi:AcrR family transcriptional regulator